MVMPRIQETLSENANGRQYFYETPTEESQIVHPGVLGLKEIADFDSL